jgi:predicted HTH transcriptional regulator
LLNEKHELKNREMKVYIDEDTINHNETMLGLIMKDNQITANMLSKMLNKGVATIKRELKRLKENGYIKREGSDKTGR